MNRSDEIFPFGKCEIYLAIDEILLRKVKFASRVVVSLCDLFKIKTRILANSGFTISFSQKIFHRRKAISSCQAGFHRFENQIDIIGCISYPYGIHPYDSVLFCVYVFFAVYSPVSTGPPSVAVGIIAGSPSRSISCSGVPKVYHAVPAASSLQ